MELTSGADYTLQQAAAYVGVTEPKLLEWIDSDTRISGSFTAMQLAALRTKYLEASIHAVVDEPEIWLDTPNPWTGGATPRELLGTDREQLVIDIVDGLKHGGVA